MSEIRNMIIKVTIMPNLYVVLKLLALWETFSGRFRLYMTLHSTIEIWIGHHDQNCLNKIKAIVNNIVAMVFSLMLEAEVTVKKNIDLKQINNKLLSHKLVMCENRNTQIN